MGPNVGPLKGTQKAHIEQGRVEGPCTHKEQLTIGEERESTE